MPGKTTIACTQEQYTTLITTIFEGVKLEGNRAIMPNPRIATALEIEANTGLRIGDIISLKLSGIIRDGDRWRFNIVEEKTKKKRTFTVPDAVYTFLADYCKKFHIDNNELIFPLTERSIQKHLQKVCEYLGYEHISTHSFRKMFGTSAYEKSGKDIELVRRLFQHSSVAVTRRYIGIPDEKVDSVLNSCVNLVKG